MSHLVHQSRSSYRAAERSSFLIPSGTSSSSNVGGVQPEVRRGLPHDVEEGEEGREGGVHRGHSLGQVTVGRGERGRGEESALTDGRPA
jgi:hypothetical protein